MRLTIGTFKAKLPRFGEKLLPEQNATVASGSDLTSGELRPYHKPMLVQQLRYPGSKNWATIHLWRDSDGNGHWLQFPGDVDVANGPVADDVWQRVYWTGDSRYDKPMMAVGGGAPSMGGIIDGVTPMPAHAYALGVPAPLNEIVVALDPSKSGAISAVAATRPIRVTTASAHGLETFDTVTLNVKSEAASEGKTSLSELLNGQPWQIEVEDATHFKILNTDAFNIHYSSFTSGTFEQYYDPGLKETRFYVFTYVTEIGEEGAPSDPSSAVIVGSGQGAVLTLPSLDPNAMQGRVIERIRIYRTATGNTSSGFFFVADVPASTHTFHDTVSTENLGELVPSTTWDMPNPKMRGLCMSAQGFGVGFFDNKLCFSEPNLPHAWPTNYELALDYPIVGIAVVDDGVVVGTTGRPYIVQGIDPRGMMPRQLMDNYACVSKRSMVSFGYSAMYASARGLVMVAGGVSQLITAGVLDEDDWALYWPETIIGVAYNGIYIGFYNNGAFMFDPNSPETGIVDLDIKAKHGVIDATERFMYYLDPSDKIYRWNDPGAALEPYDWRSKVFVTAKPENMSCAKIGAETYPVGFSLYADGVLKINKQVMDNNPFVLPSGYLARNWQIHLDGTAHVQDVHISDSYAELE